MAPDDDHGGEDRLGIEPSGRRRLATPTFERIGGGLRPLGSGETSLPGLDFSDVSVDVPMPSGEQEVGSLRLARPTRVPGNWERRLRLTTAATLLLLVLLLFGEALIGALGTALSGRVDDRWRAVDLVIQSRPQGAPVFIQDRPVGRTPLSLSRRCRGRMMRVRVALAGYQVWQWRGICPESGVLSLEAPLQPRGAR